MSQYYRDPEEYTDHSNRIKIPYQQLRSMGFLRAEMPKDLPALEEEFCSRRVIEGETGWGIIERWPVFPGMDLFWFDMNTEHALDLSAGPEYRLEILCCYEGRCEIRSRARSYYYAEPGDIAVCRSSSRNGLSGFPGERFSGICIRINMNPETRDLTGILKNFSIHLPDLYVAAGKAGILRLSGCSQAQHILSELRENHDQFRPDFLKLKIIELLLVLSDPETISQALPWSALTSYQVKTVREIRDFMVQHFDEHHTVTDISGRFHFSATSLKQWFRMIYGTSMYAYLKSFRMDIAKALLTRTDHSILQVALYVGYENPSKFSSAFRDEVGMTPKQYRLTRPNLVHIPMAN